MTCNVIVEEVKYGRTAYLNLEKDEVIFDTSDGEYGPVRFKLEILKKAIADHELQENKNS
jgi:hypothetical protein